MNPRRLILSTSCALLLAQSAPAQDIFTWTGGGADGNWSRPANWNPGVPDGNDVLNFSGTTNLLTNNDLTNVGGVPAGYGGYRIFFTPGAGSFTLSGNPVSLFDFGGQAPKIENNSANLQTISLPLTLTGAASPGNFVEINPVTGDLLLTSSVAIAGGHQLRIFGNNGKTVTFNGVLSGTGSTFAINQNSNVVFGAANTYTGDTLINAGSLSIEQGASLSAGTVQLGDTASTGAGATLRISDLDGGTTFARPIVVRAGSTGTKTIAAANTSGTNTFSGTIALNTGVTVDVAGGGIGTFGGIISGGNGITKTGDGLAIFSGANTFSGGIAVNAGRVRFTVANTMSGGITLNAGGTVELNTAAADNAAFNNLLGAASNAFIFNGGTLLMNAGTTGNVDRTLTARHITVNEGGAILDIAGNLPNFIEGQFNQLRFNGTSVLSGTGTLTKNGGGRLQFQNATATNFSGAVVINDGTLEASGTALGNSSPTNTIRINGGILALTGTANQPLITLNGGALTLTGGNRTVNSQVDVVAPSYVFLNDFWRDFDSANAASNIGRILTISGQLTGSASLDVAVNRPGYRWNTGALVLQNPTNDYSGVISVGKNLRLENNPTGGFGKTIGTAEIVLAEGTLTLRDNGLADNETLVYGNDVTAVQATDILNRGTLPGAATIDVNRTTSGFTSGNVFQLGKLVLASPTLTITGGNGYGVEFAGASQFTGDATLNVNAPLTFSSTFSQDATGGRTLTKNGAATLRFDNEVNHTGATIVNDGALQLAGAAGRLSGTSAVTLGSGSALIIDNSAAGLANRVPDAAPISMTDAAITFSSLVGAATTGHEVLGAVTLNGSNTITVNRGNVGAISALTLSSLTRASGATVQFIGNDLGQPGNTSRVIIASQTTDVPFLGAWATVGNEFAQYIAALDNGFARGVAAVNSVVDPNENAFTAGANVKLTGTTTTTLLGNRTINSLNFANVADTRTLNLGGNTLTIESGGLLVGTNNSVITSTAAGGLTAGTGAAADLIVTNNGPLTIGAPIRNNGAGVVTVVKSGSEVLTLSGSSTFTGPVRILEGTVSVGDVANSGAASHLGSGNAVVLSSSETVATLQFTGGSDATNRALTVGAAGGIIDVSATNGALQWSGAVDAAGSLTKIGAGALTFNGANIAGNVVVDDGTMNLGGTNSIAGSAIVNGGSLTLGGSTTINGSALVNGGSLTLAEFVTVFGALNVANGSTGLITGAATILGDLNVGNGSDGTLTGSLGGSLSVGSGSSNAINIGAETIPTAAATVGIVDLGELSSFSANVGIIRVGVEGPGANGTGSNTGTLILPTNSNIIATTSILVADSPGNGNGGTRGTLTFGSGINDLTTPLLTIGGRKYSGVSTISPGGTLVLKNGTGRTTLNIGTNSGVDTGTMPTSSLNLTGGTMIASLGQVSVATRAGGGAVGTSTATFNLGNSPDTNVNISVTTGQALRIGLLDYTGGAQPTSEQANGTMIIGGGTVVVNTNDTGSSAIVVGNFTNTTTAINNAAANNSSNGTLTINGGNVTVTSGGSANAINLAPRSVLAASVGANTSTGTLNINGGTLTVNNQIQGNSLTGGNQTSNLNLAGGTLNMQGKNITGITNLTFSGGTLLNLGTLNRPLTQTGELSLLDVLGNNATITGAYLLTDGEVRVDAARSLNVSGGMTLNGTATAVINGALTGSLTTVNVGATLMGNGVVGPVTLAGGTLAPGNSPGILSTGNLTLSGGRVAFELNGVTAGTFDQINTTGTISLTADTEITISLGFIPAVNDQWVLFNNDGTDAITGLAAGHYLTHGGRELLEGDTFLAGGEHLFSITYQGGANNNDVVLISQVPEPAAVGTLLSGLGLLLGFRRSRG